MKIYRQVYSPIEVNTYVITGDDASCVIIDCGCYTRQEEENLENLFSETGFIPLMLVNTHCHLDHVFGNRFMLRKHGLSPWFDQAELSNNTNAPKHALMFGLKMEPPPEPSGYLSDHEVIFAAGMGLEVIAVPGHSAGGVAFYSADDGVVFTGDALFAGSIGRSDLPGGNHEQLLFSIRSRLFALPPDTVVYPGHGPATTIGEEIRNNPYFR
jgi:glyoxylase-like metal-dependent hydrolase (beta-lactamase superfamily II)